MASGPKCTLITHTHTHTTAATAILPTAIKKKKKEDQNSANKQDRVLKQVGLHFQCVQIRAASEQRLKSETKMK